MWSPGFRNTVWLFILALVLLFFSGGRTRAAVNMSFSRDTDNWQRNGVYEITIVLENTEAEEVNIAGVQVDFNYPFGDYKEIPVVTEDNFTGFNFFVNDVSTNTEGEGIYRKSITASANPNYRTMAASSTWELVTFSFRVKADAVLGTSNFEFKNEVAIAGRLESGDTDNVMGSVQDSSSTIIVDTTSPNTYAIPSSCTLKSGNSTQIRLDEVETPDYDDLAKVYYEVGEPPVSDPDGGSAWISEGERVQLPVNDASHPGKITASLKYFGEDGYGNQESSINTETYTVDIINPTIDTISSYPGYAKLGTTITVNFSVDVDEDIVSDPTVMVNNNLFTKTSGHPDYQYRYTTTQDDSQGQKTIYITVTDEVGNQTVDTTQTVTVDFTVPTYTPVSFLPDQVDHGEILTIKFTASELLDIGNTVVSMDGNAASYLSRSGLQYTYQYQISPETPESGWEETGFILVHGYDLSGNESFNNTGWSDVLISGDDQYGNPGEREFTINLEYKRR